MNSYDDLFLWAAEFADFQIGSKNQDFDPLAVQECVPNSEV